jgi:hypothetical protein
MTDTDPPYEVGDVPTPSHRLIQIPLPHPINDFHGDGNDPEYQYGDRDKEANPPCSRGSYFHRPANIFRDLVVVFITFYKGSPDL